VNTLTVEPHYTDPDTDPNSGVTLITDPYVYMLTNPVLFEPGDYCMIAVNRGGMKCMVEVVVTEADARSCRVLDHTSGASATVEREKCPLFHRMYENFIYLAVHPVMYKYVARPTDDDHIVVGGSVMYCPVLPCSYTDIFSVVSISSVTRDDVEINNGLGTTATVSKRDLLPFYVLRGYNLSRNVHFNARKVVHLLDTPGDKVVLSRTFCLVSLSHAILLFSRER
jgi:hypothetical protein